MITLYTSSTCPKCKVIKSKLKSKNIPYSECQDIPTMENLGIQSLPALQVDSKLILDFTQINAYINTLWGDQIWLENTTEKRLWQLI